MSKEKQTAKLNNWSVITHPMDAYKAPEQAIPSLQGEVVGHPNPKIADGTTIVTSPITMISYKSKIAETMNTVYELGEPDPEFVEFLTANGHSIEKYESVTFN